MTNSIPNPCKGYRFPAEIISHCVWLYANEICCRRPQPTDKWHLDEVVITIDGQMTRGSTLSSLDEGARSGYAATLMPLNSRQLFNR